MSDSEKDSRDESIKDAAENRPEDKSETAGEAGDIQKNAPENTGAQQEEGSGGGSAEAESSAGSEQQMQARPSGHFPNTVWQAASVWSGRMRIWMPASVLWREPNV